MLGELINIFQNWPLWIQVIYPLSFVLGFFSIKFGLKSLKHEGLVGLGIFFFLIFFLFTLFLIRGLFV